VPALVLVVALLLGVAAIAGDTVSRHRELDRLLARVLDAQEAIAYSNNRVAATVDYTLPLLFGASVPPRVRAGLQQLVEDSAASQVADIAKERSLAEQATVLPWHRSLRRAKAALVTYLAARVAYLRSVAADQQVLYVEHPELEALLDDTRAAFRAAAGPGGHSRIEAAFAGGIHPA
jgi:hypothetical protein